MYCYYCGHEAGEFFFEESEGEKMCCLECGDASLRWVEDHRVYVPIEVWKESFTEEEIAKVEQWSYFELFDDDDED